MAQSDGFSFDLTDGNHIIAKTGDAPKGGAEAVSWVVVARTAGLLPAQIIAGSLNAAGIPARAQQESAGQAFGFTVGLLGEGRVLTPDGYATEALEFLAARQDEELK